MTRLGVVPSRHAGGFHDSFYSISFKIRQYHDGSVARLTEGQIFHRIRLLKWSYTLRWQFHCQQHLLYLFHSIPVLFMDHSVVRVFTMKRFPETLCPCKYSLLSLSCKYSLLHLQISCLQCAGVPVSRGWLSAPSRGQWPHCRPLFMTPAAADTAISHSYQHNAWRSGISRYLCKVATRV